MVEKWRNIRDAYNRTLKSKPGEEPKRKYVYHNYLLFLYPTVKKERILSSFAEDTEEGYDVGEPKTEYRPISHERETRRTRKRNMDETAIKAPEATRAVSQQKEADEDESFFLSLLPSVRGLNQDDKLQFRVEVIQLLQKFKRQAYN